MAYNANNEIKTQLLLVPKSEGSTEYIKVEQIKYKDNSKGPAIDIRNMYTNIQEILPTKKGVRIPDSLALDIFLAAFKGLSKECQMDLYDAISEYMESSDDEDEEDEEDGDYLEGLKESN